MQKINLKDIINQMDLEILCDGGDTPPDIGVSDLNRPGLELAGFFDYFAFERIQILGMTEISFMESLPARVRRERLEKLLSYEIPCVIVTRKLTPPSELIEIARKYKRFVLTTPAATTRFISKLTDYLESELAPRTTMHGVLVDIYGVGVLILGESGIGKSETAVELIKRGHRLVADDAVEIKEVSKNVLVGTAPELIRYYLEVRGLGVIDVKTIFGAGAVRDDIKIEMVIEVVEWEKFKVTDRLGLEEECINILNSSIPKKTIPIRPGRNLAAILEVAAMDFRLKKMGYNAALQFSKKLFKELNEKNK